jgi:hypothetical protein
MLGVEHLRFWLSTGLRGDYPSLIYTLTCCSLWFSPPSACVGCGFNVLSIIHDFALRSIVVNIGGAEDYLNLSKIHKFRNKFTTPTVAAKKRANKVAKKCRILAFRPLFQLAD